MPPPPPPSPLPPPPPLQPEEVWGPFYVIVKETFDSTRNFLVGGDANPDTTAYPELKCRDNEGSLVVGDFAPPGSPPEVVILTGGVKYEYETPSLARDVFSPGTQALPGGPLRPQLPEVHLMTKLKVADLSVPPDALNDLIATFVDGTTKVYLNQGSSIPNDFSAVTPIVIKAPAPGSTTPITTDVVVADVNEDGTPDIITVNDGGENLLYLGPLTFDPHTKAATNPGTILGTDPATKYDPATGYAPSLVAHDESASQSVEVADVDGDGDLDIIVGNLGSPNVVYFQEGTPNPGGLYPTGKFPTATPIGDTSTGAFDADSPTTKVVVADLDKDGTMDLVVANRDEENQIFLAKGASGGVLDKNSLSTAPSESLALPYYNWPKGVIGAEWQENKLTTEDIAVADMNGDGVLDIVTAEKGAPNMLYLGDDTKPGDYKTVTVRRPILPIPIALKDAPTWYESAYAGTDVATGSPIGGTERLTWGQYKGEVDDTYQITPFDVDSDGDLDLVVGSRDQTAKVYFNDGNGGPLNFEPQFDFRTKLGEPYDTGPSAVGIDTTENPAIDTTGLATAVDLNGDGYPDVVTGTEVFLNPGHGEFTNVKGMPWRDPTIAGDQDATISIEGVDVDGDGDNDLVVSQRSTSSTNGGIFVLYNPGDGLLDAGDTLNGWWGNPNSMQKVVSATSAGGVAHTIKAPDSYKTNP